MEKIKLLICGLPGSGKTSLAKRLSSELNAVWFNGDEIRSGISKDLGFSEDDRVEQARRMGFLCDIVLRVNPIVIADFVCPTNRTRICFNANKVIYMNTIQEGRYEDTNKLFVPPNKPDIEITSFDQIKEINWITNLIPKNS